MTVFAQDDPQWVLNCSGGVVVETGDDPAARKQLSLHPSDIRRVILIYVMRIKLPMSDALNFTLLISPLII